MATDVGDEEMVGPGVIRLPETNIAPENRPSQTETSIETIHLSGAMLVSGMVNYTSRKLTWNPKS